MAEPIISPINPNLGPQGEGIAGASGAIFTATDRQIIKERTGEIDPSRSFKEVFFDKGATAGVENEEGKAAQGQDPRALRTRSKEHKKMLRNAPLHLPQERVEILNHPRETEPVELRGKPSPPAPEPQPEPLPEISPETLKLAEELDLNPAEIFDKLNLEQDQLHSLISRIKESHLQRLLCSSEEEFRALTRSIHDETISAGKPEARTWLETQLNRLALVAAEYKIKFFHSLEQLQGEESRQAALEWLDRIVKELRPGSEQAE